MLSAAALCTANSSYASSAAQHRSDKPNVILILIDDLSYFGVSAYGLESVSGSGANFKRESLQTPRMDELAGQGILCSHAYSHALSEATRVALMTGMNNGRIYLATKALHESQITFADVFKLNGYTTGMYGKWKQSRGSAEVPAKEHISAFGWDDYTCFDMVTANQRHINPDLVINDVVTNYNKRTDIDPETGRRWFGPDIFNRNAIKFIESNKDKPFFLYYPMVMIHDDHKPTPDSTPKSIFDEAEESNKNDMRDYLPDMIRYTDKLIGRIVDKVNDLGLRENTLIIVMGDNGSKEFITFHQKDGTSYKGGKGQTTAGGERVPLILSQPGVIPTSGTKEVRSYYPAIDITDIYPTMFEACGITPPNQDKIDGVSFWKQTIGKSKEAHREHIYKWYNANRTQKELDLMVRYAQTPEYKYYAPHDAYPEGRFFDVKVDYLEKEGTQGRKLGWEKYWYAGKDLKKLNAKEQAAYKMLKAEIDRHEYKAVEKIEIKTKGATMSSGDIKELAHAVYPANATRNGVIWHSSAPEVASVDKFGRVTAHKSGEATITLYSWDDAWPVANGKNGGYLKDGMNDKVIIKVK